MEPLTAFSLACNIFTVLDFSQKLVSGFHRVYSSVDGATSENVDLAETTSSLKALIPRLNATSEISASKDDVALNKLAENCKALAGDLLALLATLQVRRPGSKSESLRVALRNMLKKDEVASLERRLQMYRSQILTTIAVLIREEQLSAGKDIKHAVHDNREISSQILDSVNKTREDILKAIEEFQAGVASQSADSMANIASQTRAIEDLHSMFSQMSDTATRMAYEKQVLDKLGFEEMYYREYSIEREHAKTFRWLLYDSSENDSDNVDSNERQNRDISSYGSTASSSRRSSTQVSERDESNDNKGNDNAKQRDSTDNLQHPALTIPHEEEKHQRSETRESFLAWLNSGSGIFYISGKAGSGKSTLMKYICQQGRVLEELEKWASRKKLIVAQFFFWAAGAEKQKSLEGLYRAILSKVLHACPELISELFPLGDVSTGHGRTSLCEPSTVESAFQLLVKRGHILERHRFCFFIDGLDEFDGDYWTLAKSLQAWSKASDVKICVAGRPYNEFERIFDSPSQRLRLHELTEGDMKIFVKEKFWQDERFLDVRDTDPKYDELVQQVVGRADGVFLWVRLVTQELLHGMGNRYSISKLFKHLYAMPSELRGLFRSMFQSIDKLDREGAARSFLLLVMKEGSWSPLVHSVIDDFCDGSYNTEELYNGQLGPVMGLEETSRRESIICQRVVNRCKGLVQDLLPLHISNDIISFRRFDFIHRSVEEYLTDEDVRSELLASAKGFDVQKHVCLAYLRLFKALVYSQRRDGDLANMGLANLLQCWVLPMLFQCSRLESRSFVREMDAMYAMTQKLPAILKPPSEDTYQPLTHMTPCPIGSVANFFAAPERLFMSLAADFGCRDFCMSHVSTCTAVLGPLLPNELLLRSSVANSRLMSSYTSVTTQPMMAELINAGASPNGIIPNYLIILLESKEQILENEQWTPWTLFLYLSFSMRIYDIWCPLQAYHKTFLHGNFFNNLETYIKHGADPTVLFFACIHQKGGPKKLYYFDLYQLVQLLTRKKGPDLQQVLLQATTRHWTWDFSGWFIPWERRKAIMPPIPRMDTEMLHTSRFHIWRVVGRDQAVGDLDTSLVFCGEGDEEMHLGRPILSVYYQGKNGKEWFAL